MHLAAPTPPSSRYQIIDIVRGFALFGVLLANMIWTTQHFAVLKEQLAAPLDDVIGSGIVALVDYKFYTLFSMLFGLGFALQLSKAEVRGQNILPTFTRRLFILLLMGVIHATLIWFGDILHVYAIMGFVLMAIYRLKDELIIKIAIAIAGLILLLPVLQSLYFNVPTGVVSGMSESELVKWRFNSLTSSQWIQYIFVNWHFNFTEYSNFSLEFDGAIYWFLSVLWKFMIGFVMGRKLMLQDINRYLPFYRKFLPWGIVIGLNGALVLFVSVYAYEVWIPDLNSAWVLLWLPVEISMFALSLSYMAVLIILYQKPYWKKILSQLAPVGRLALTNYLTQSIFLILVFYGIGFGLLGKIGNTLCLVLSLVFFALQVFYSRWWLSRYRFGPMEWAWRSLTYGKLQKL